MANYINKNSKDDKNKNTETGKIPQNKNNETEYITSKDFDKVKNLEQFKEFNSYYGVSDNVEIIFKTETGEIKKFNSFSDFQAWGSEQEKQEHIKYVNLGNEALEKLKVAKTKEEKKKYEAQFEYYYSLIHEKMQNVQDRQSLGGKYTTGNYLTKSAVSYNGKTLVVSAEKYAGEIGAEHIGIFFQGMGKIGTEIWSNQKIKAESNLSQKYNNDVIKYSDNTYKRQRNSDIDFINGKGKSTLDSHVKRHRENVGAKNKDEYVDMARDFLEKPATSTTKSFVSPDGTYFRYDTATNEFGIINEYGGVSTYFKPDTKLDYWTEQVMRYAPQNRR